MSNQALIDILAAIESTVEAAIAIDAQGTCAACDGQDSVAERAFALAVPAARQPRHVTTLLDSLRADPAGTARAFGCSLGAVLVWRAVDRHERAGRCPLDAAEAGLRAALAYVELAPVSQCASVGVDDPRRCAALTILEVQARLALSRTVEETA